MAFYQFLAIFPALLIAFALLARVPHLTVHLKAALGDFSNQLFPARVAQLFAGMSTDFRARPRFGFRLLSVFAAAVWAAHNGTWAMVYGLNRAYEVQENRSPWRLTLVIVLLTLCMVATACVALLLLVCSAYLQAHLRGGTVFLRSLEWLTLAASLSICFTALYRFAPNLPHHRLRWSTPGALCALLLWVVCIVAVHIYFNHFNDYARSYGPLNGVVMLLLWLYASNGALLVGGEMNSEIRKAEAARCKGSEAISSSSHGARAHPS